MFLSARRLVCAVFVMVLGVLALVSATALAAAPETPQLTVEVPVHATETTLHGVLDSLAAGEAGIYEFLYKQGKAGCAGAGKAPEPAGLMTGSEHEEVSETLTGLTQGSEYTVCLRVENTSTHKEALSAPVTFTTAVKPEIPETFKAGSITTTTATLEGVLNPATAGNAGTYEFLYNEGASCEGGATTAAGAMTGSVGQAVEAELSGLPPSATYTFCLLARNEAGETAVSVSRTFTTLTVAPTIEAESSSNVGSSSVSLSARIDPSRSASVYFFEYGTSVAYGSVTATESLGAEPETVGVLANVSGLQAGTLYHFRVVARNASGETSYGADTTFTTYPAAVPGLPEGRFYELVSPALPGNATVYDPWTDGAKGENSYGFFSSERAVRAAADGSALAYISTPSPEGGFGQYGTGDGDQWLARRSAAGGWTNSVIQPLSGEDTEYEGFSNDLSVGVVPTGSTEGAPGGLYARDLDDLGVGSYSFLAPGASYAGSTADMSHVLFTTGEALTALAKEDPPSGEQQDLYDSVGGQLYLVNVLPDGKVAPGSVFGGPNYDGFDSIVGFKNERSNFSPNYSNVISSDGSRVFWTDQNDHYLYVRENDTQPQSPVNGEGHCTVAADACTILIDGSGDGRFWTAAPDGSRVFFTDCNRLTPNSTAVYSNAECGYNNSGEGESLNLEGNDLYEYNLENGSLTDLTVDPNVSDSLGANVQGVLGVSDDGSYVYFVAGGVLAPGATLNDCKQTEVGTGGNDSECNLYVLHVGEAPKFISRLTSGTGEAEGDDSVSSYGEGELDGDWMPGVGTHTAQVTPNGLHLIYLHGEYVRCPGCNPYRYRQIYMYDFGAAGPHCISCSPVGAEGGVKEPLGLPISGHKRTYVPRVMTADGDRVFFDSRLALVPQDTNGRMDVYEWVRDGSGGCELERGCLYLLSGGTSDEGSYFLEASENGDDVFIVTSAQLGPQLQGENPHVIDVRTGTPLAVSECAGSGCQGVPGAPPIFATPSSVTFEGVGDFEPATPAVAVKAKPRAKPAKCKKGFVKKNGKCVKKSKAKGKTKAKKANNDRGAK